MTHFIHLRNHTEYSLCSGALRIKDIANATLKHNMPAAAITDTGNLFGALEYSCTLQKCNIQPIVGSELLVDFTSYLSEQYNTNTNLCKIVLLAATKEGYLNLIALVSDSFLKRETGSNPHIKLEWLKEKNKGLICLSAGPEGILGKTILTKQTQKTEQIAKDFKEIFNNDRFYIELMRHGIKDEIETEQAFIDLAYKLNIPLVATNNCYFLKKEMFEAQDALSCIAENRYISETDRHRLTPEHYLKSSQEMIDLFSDIPEAIENTIKIAKRCNTMAYERPPTLPHFTLPKGVTEADHLKNESKKGLKERLEQKYKLENITDSEKQKEVEKLYTEQLEYELEVIITMDFPGYFLIVSDFIIWSKNNGIPVGPGRGSGPGSVVSWSLKITDLDPIRFSLFFERFLNPERVSMPDFDIDFCQRRRGEVIEYVKNKYGADMVAQIITFGKLQAKAVVKDVGRVLQMGYNEVDKISKVIPFNTSLEEAIELDEDLKDTRNTDPRIDRLLNISLQLEGLNRHASVHAAGVVIGDKPLQEICALCCDDKSDMQTVQYPMKWVDKVGLVKFDFLGLKTLTTIKDTVTLIKQRNIEIDIDNIRLDDKEIFDMLKTGDSMGVFQIESSGMRSMLRQIKPDYFEDIIALISLYRPGPMDNIPMYIKRKHGLEPIEYPHPKVAHILKETYGIIVYQEQVMDIAKILAGYSLGGADMLRRAMGKKILEEMDKQREIFVKGCKKHNDINEHKANEIFDLLAKFASYGFNKAHAASYALIGYQTAFLKQHYPIEFLTATINMDIHDSDKINLYLQDVKAHDIKILPPDINKSHAYFSVEQIDYNPEDRQDSDVKKYDNVTNKELAIRYGLAAVKGVGIGVMEDLMTEREKNKDFKNIFDFTERVGTKTINKKTIESLAKSGAFDKIHKNRRQVHDSCETLSNYCTTIEEEKNSSQMSIFGSSNIITSKPILQNVDDWQGNERFQKEFESFGFYLNDHPLDIIKKDLHERGITFTGEIAEDKIQNYDKIRIAGVVINTKIKSGNKGRYAFVSISDPEGMQEVVIFDNDLITANKDLLNDKENHQIVIECSIRKNEGGTRVLTNNIVSLKEFLKNNKPGSLVKVIKSTRRKDYRKPQEPTIRLIQSQEVKILQEITIHINSRKPLQELSTIIKNTQSRNLSQKTKVVISIHENDNTTNIDLGNNYYLTQKDEQRIKETAGIVKTENVII